MFLSQTTQAKNMDIIIIIIILVGTVRGFISGIIQQIGSIAGLVLGYIGAKLAGPHIAEILHNTFHISEPLNIPLAYFVTFLIIMISCQIPARILRKVIHWSQLGWADRLVGGLFCGFKYALIISIILNFGSLFSRHSHPEQGNEKENSYFYSRIVALAPRLFYEATRERNGKEVKKVTSQNNTKTVLLNNNTPVYTASTIPTTNK